MNNSNVLTVFNNADFGAIRTTMIDGEPWFVGKDVATALGYQNGSRDINRHVDEDDRRMYRIGTTCGEQDSIVINESGLYSLIMSSKLPAAKKFKRWVTSEVLPSIRKTGKYAVPAFSDIQNTIEHMNIYNRRKIIQTTVRGDTPELNFENYTSLYMYFDAKYGINTYLLLTDAKTNGTVNSNMTRLDYIVFILGMSKELCEAACSLFADKFQSAMNALQSEDKVLLKP